MVVLTHEAQRVLGCLVEKAAFTPDAYPLTLHSLVLGCNQTSNRDPVVDYGEPTVLAALDQLREAGLTRVVHSSQYRATKYRHVAGEALGLTSGELAVLAVLLLRGPQTVNELRTRTERYGGDLDDLGGVEGVLGRLAREKEETFVVRIARHPGQREERWAHLLGPAPDVGGPGSADPPVVPSGVPGGSAPRAGAVALAPGMPEGSAPRAGALADLGAEVRALRDELDRLREEVAQLRRRLDCAG